MQVVATCQREEAGLYFSQLATLFVATQVEYMLEIRAINIVQCNNVVPQDAYDFFTLVNHTLKQITKKIT